jgi:hypothetical protein
MLRFSYEPRKDNTQAFDSDRSDEEWELSKEFFPPIRGRFGLLPPERLCRRERRGKGRSGRGARGARPPDEENIEEGRQAPVIAIRMAELRLKEEAVWENAKEELKEAALFPRPAFP